MLTFDGNLILLSQGGNIVCQVCILTILRYHCKGSYTHAEKCQIGQLFTAVEGAGIGWLGYGVFSGGQHLQEQDNAIREEHQNHWKGDVLN